MKTAGTSKPARQSSSVPKNFVNLHTRSFYSFGEGASHTHELLTRAKSYGYSALALTDTNLCGALEFARLANNIGVKPITGSELVLTDESRLVLLAKTREGYANISRLLTLANAADRQKPRIDPSHLQDHTEGVILLTGGRTSHLARLATGGLHQEAIALLNCYQEWYGPESVYVELQQNFLQGDTVRNHELADLAQEVGLPLVATNDVLYHDRKRYRLQHALAAAKRNTTIDRALPFIQPNAHLSLKAPEEMACLFHDYPEAIENTLRIANLCRFNLSTDLGYTLPAPSVPTGNSPETYLRQLCEEAARRRYGTLTEQVRKRLDEEFRLINQNHLAGFLLLYRKIVQLGRLIMEERRLIHPDTPLEERPPGRGRGSSVALLVGYLIGISHIDPLSWNLTLERFMPEDMTTVPDIDLDFPRSIRDELITRVHQHFGAEYAVLVGAISTYSLKGVIQDLGKALGLPREDLQILSKQIQPQDSELRNVMLSLPVLQERVDTPGWRELTELAPQLLHAPRSLGQHVGGMILSDSPIPDMVPIRDGAITGRFIMDWNKDSVADANFAKIDILSLPVLDQIEEALDLIEEREGTRPDLSRIDPEDPIVYDMINEGRTKGVFLLQSPAQLKISQRLLSRNLLDLAYQVALIRPGVGMQGGAVSQFIERHRHGTTWKYAHPLEERALERGYGIVIWQEQVVQLIMDVAGMTAAEADELRRDFTRPQNKHLITIHRQRFLEGAQRKGVPEETAHEIFNKINGHYMFPESHSHAFAISAYQAAWLKRHYPLEFFVGLVNNQPMGFYPLETLKEDARRFDVPFLNPCVNRSEVRTIPDNGFVQLGLHIVKDVGQAAAELIVAERELHGPYIGAEDLVRRTRMKPQAVRSLVEAGALESIAPNRRLALWNAGLSTPPSRDGQRAFPRSTAGVIPELADFSAFEKMAGEYRTMGVYPRGHLMEFIRPTLPANVLLCAETAELPDKAAVHISGWPIARQHPRGKEGMAFVTIEDESGEVQVVLWPHLFARHQNDLRSQIVLIRGTISRWDGTATITVSHVKPISTDIQMPDAHDWH